MKKFLAVVFCIALLPAIVAYAQSSHYTTVFWTAPSDATSNTTYTVYAASGACPASGIPTGASVIKGNLTATTYNDPNVVVGQTKCYYVVAVTNGESSGPSNTSPATTPALPASGCNTEAH